MSETISGGCLCGNIRYETTAEPAFPLLCYCTDCQTISGAAGYAAYGVPIDSIVVTRGEPAVFDIQADSGRINSRRFCPDCGTRVWAQLDEMGLASVNGLTLDQRDHFRPSANHLPDSAPSWCVLDETLEVFPPVPRDQ
jgi:hypothetical protein